MKKELPPIVGGITEVSSTTTSLTEVKAYFDRSEEHAPSNLFRALGDPRGYVEIKVLDEIQLANQALSQYAAIG